MKERTGIITVEGNPLTLIGEELKVGQSAPEAELLDNDLKPVKLSSYKGKVTVVSVVPSLDTPVCDKETRRFNEEAVKLGPNVSIVTVSMDLPFAQKRWCGAAGVKNVATLSDHRNANFGTGWGNLIRELRLLSRVIYILDKEGAIRYIQRVNEITNEPNYDEVISEVKKLV